MQVNLNRYKPRRSAARWLAGAPPHVVAIYDKPSCADRYTVLYGAPIWTIQHAAYWARFGRPDVLPGRGMSADPCHPQGVGQYFEDAQRGPHLGRKITWTELPEACKRLVISDGQA